MASYLRIKQIGTGGFGTVWECERKEDGKIFAQKLLDEGVDEDSLVRFRREVRILSQLDHPNVIKVVGRRLEDAPYYYVMPKYRASLRSEIDAMVGDEDRIKTVFLQILDAIEYAHGQGVIHRDLKPENVLVNTDTDIVVSDFGLGRILTSDSTRQTLTGFGMGTPLYMAPEQFFDAKNASPASDVYALGRILLELYQGPLSFALIDFNGLPPPISVLVRRCLERDPLRRFSTVTELKAAFRSIYDSAAVARELDNLNGLLARLAVAYEPTVNDARLLATGLVARLKDSDFVLSALMTVPTQIFPLVEHVDRDMLRVLLGRFAEIVISQGWPFDFTDKIGDTCEKIYFAITDFEGRAELIYAAVEVGSSHNRWHVLEAAGKMLIARKRPGEAIPIKEKLTKIKEHLDTLKRYISVAKLDPLLQTLFE